MSAAVTQGISEAEAKAMIFGPGEVKASEAKPDALAAMGFTPSAEVASSAFSRTLILGPGKKGKTTALLTSAPSPIALINCDGDSATKYAIKHGAAGRFHQLDALNAIGLRKAVTAACRAANDGLCKTVILDSLSLAGERILREYSVKFSDSRERFREYQDLMIDSLIRLCDANAHVFITCHMSPASEDEGILPLIAGATKYKALNIVNDVVIFDYVAGRSPHERMFLIGPQKDWNYSGRAARRACAVPATVPALFEELGIAP